MHKEMESEFLTNSGGLATLPPKLQVIRRWLFGAFLQNPARLALVSWNGHRNRDSSRIDFGWQIVKKNCFCHTSRLYFWNEFREYSRGKRPINFNLFIRRIFWKLPFLLLHMRILFITFSLGWRIWWARRTKTASINVTCLVSASLLLNFLFFFFTFSVNLKDDIAVITNDLRAFSQPVSLPQTIIVVH